MGRPVFGLASLLSQFCALYFGIFSHSSLAENGQQDRPSSRGKPVGDADGGTIHRWAELADAVTEISGVGFAERLCLFSE